MQLKEIGARLKTLKLGKTETHMLNLERIAEVCHRFHRDAGTLTEKVIETIERTKESNTNTIVIEAAHQPNFLPYYGVWKKAFMASYLMNQLDNEGLDSVALFGFFDQDTTMNSYLYANKVPYPCKEGFKRIGFKPKGKNFWWKRWDLQPLPPKDKWDRRIGAIIRWYEEAGLRDDQDVEVVKRILEEVYSDATSFSGLNAFVFSRICNRLWSLPIIFFRYSDLHRACMCVAEFERLLSSQQSYVRIHNGAIRAEGLDLNVVEESHIPFWYHCDCGGKVRLRYDGALMKGTCPVCSKDHSLDKKIENLMGSISLDSVSRELVMPECLGTDVYVGGLGGSISFRKISDRLAKKLHFREPLVVSWRSYDKYISALVAHGVKRLTSQSVAEVESRESILLTQDELNTLMEEQLSHKKRLEHLTPKSPEFKQALRHLSKLNRRIRQLRERLRQTKNSELVGIEKALHIIPSFLDEIFSVGLHEIRHYWEKDVEENDVTTPHDITMVSKIG